MTKLTVSLAVLLTLSLPAHAKRWKYQVAFEHCGLTVNGNSAAVSATTNAKSDLIHCAIDELFYFQVVRDMPPVSYDSDFKACSKGANGTRPDGCYVDRFRSTGNRRFDFVLAPSGRLCSRDIFVTDEIFNRGYSDLDPDGSALWAKSWKSVAGTEASIYYSKAIDLVEALQFDLLHEYGHYLGNWDEAGADTFARDAMIGLRRTKFYWSRGVILPPFSNWVSRSRICEPPPRDKSPCMMSGDAPLEDDLPPGME